MKTSTIMWTFAVLIVLLGGGAYYYSSTIENVSPTSSTTTNEIPNPSGTNLPAGDMAPVPSEPIASSSTSVTASSSFQAQ